MPTDIQTPGSSQETLYAGQSKVITLNCLKTFLFGSSGFVDLTGTSIVSNKTLTVISGHGCANVSSDRVYCEHVEESYNYINILMEDNKDTIIMDGKALNKSCGCTSLVQN